MRCDDLEPLIEAIADDSLQLSADDAAHVATCAICAGRIERARSIESLLSMREIAQPQAAFHAGGDGARRPGAMESGARDRSRLQSRDRRRHPGDRRRRARAWHGRSDCSPSRSISTRSSRRSTPAPPAGCSRKSRPSRCRRCCSPWRSSCGGGRKRPRLRRSTDHNECQCSVFNRGSEFNLWP